MSEIITIIIITMIKLLSKCQTQLKTDFSHNTTGNKNCTELHSQQLAIAIKLFSIDVLYKNYL